MPFTYIDFKKMTQVHVASDIDLQNEYRDLQQKMQNAEQSRINALNKHRADIQRIVEQDDESDSPSSELSGGTPTNQPFDVIIENPAPDNSKNFSSTSKVDTHEELKYQEVASFEEMIQKLCGGKVDNIDQENVYISGGSSQTKLMISKKSILLSFEKNEDNVIFQEDNDEVRSVDQSYSLT